MDTISNDLIYRGLQTMAPTTEPQSCYISVSHKGQIYHLFNAERISLGRMARMCAVFMRGKNKPTYDFQKSAENGDICVIVNAKTLHVTGKKREQKLYRWHSGYFSGLKEYNMVDMIEKDPSRVVYLAIKGMLPKNKLREDILR